MTRTLTCQAPISMGFSKQEYWSGLPFPSPGDLPEPGLQPGSPALQVDSTDTHKKEQPKHNTKDGNQTAREQRRKGRKKTYKKRIQNNEQNGNKKIHTNNCLKEIKRSNQER